MWEPSAYVEGDRVNVCLEATQELAEAVAKWESAAVRLADAAPMFGKPLSPAQMQDRFQSCLKTSPQGLTFVKLKATMRNVRFWNAEGKRTEAPSSLRGRKILAAFQARQVWMMNQQFGLVLELRDCKLDEETEFACPQ